MIEIIFVRVLLWNDGIEVNCMRDITYDEWREFGTRTYRGSGNLFVLWLASWQIRIAYYTMRLSLKIPHVVARRTEAAAVGRINNNSRD